MATCVISQAGVVIDGDAWSVSPAASVGTWRRSMVGQDASDVQRQSCGRGHFPSAMHGLGETGNMSSDDAVFAFDGAPSLAPRLACLACKMAFKLFIVLDPDSAQPWIETG